MNIFNIINEEISLFENIQQAEKLLRNKNINLDNPEYLKLKKKLIDNNNIGYLGFLIKIATNSSSNNSIDFLIAEEIYDIILKNKPILNKLPKPLMQYDDAHNLADDIDSLSRNQILKKFSDKIINPTIKNNINKYGNDVDFLSNVNYFMNKVDSNDKREFLIKTNKYNNIDEFVEDFNGFVDDHKTGFSFKIVMNQIKSMKPDEIKLLFAENNMILARILKYSGSQAIGSKSWCIVGNKEDFHNYTENGKNYQYFFFNFNTNVPNEKMIAFTLDSDNQVTAAHDRYDGVFNNIIEYLNNLGVKEKIFTINARERFETNINREGIELYYKTVETKKSGKHKLLLNTPYNLESKRKLLLKFAQYVKDNINLDIVMNKFQKFPVTMVSVDRDYNYDKVSNVEYKNEIPTILLKNNVEIINNVLHNDQHLVQYMKKVFTSNIDLKEDTKVAILHFLKDNGVDILELSKHKKAKYGQDLTASEFGMLNKRGEDLKPIIQNKLAAIRRGENVNMNVNEIKYAIENGYDKIIKIYYKNNMDNYYTNQLSYEDMEIYKMLNLFGDIEKIIFQKGKNYGIDTLNSIEKSIYDMYSRKTK